MNEGGKVALMQEEVKTRCQTGCFFIYELAGGAWGALGRIQPTFMNK